MPARVRRRGAPSTAGLRVSEHENRVLAADLHLDTRASRSAPTWAMRLRTPSELVNELDG